MLQIPVLSITCVAVVLTLTGLGWYRSQRADRTSMLVWWQRAILLASSLTVVVLRLTVNSSFALLLGIVAMGIFAYIWLGHRYRRQVNVNSLTPQTEILPPLPPAMSREKLQKLQGAFSIDSFYATSINNYQDGAIVKGNLRADADRAYQQVQQGITRLLGSKYQLFLLEGQDRRPVMVVLPERAVLPPSWWQRLLCGLAIVLSVWTIGAVGSDWNLVGGLVPVVGLLLAMRELVLRWCAHRWGVAVSLPYALPSTQLGSFGLFSRFLSPLPNRQVLLELAIAPPLTSGGCSLLLLLVGLLLSGWGYGTIELPSQVFQASALVAILTKLVLGAGLHQDFVQVHSLVLLGWVGLTITALNLLPAGQLDGGRLVQAIYGRRTASWTTGITLLCMAIVSLINPIALFWGVIILVLLRDLEAPMQNELSETAPAQDALGILLLFIMAICLLPLTPTVAEYLQIGA